MWRPSFRFPKSLKEIYTLMKFHVTNNFVSFKRRYTRNSADASYSGDSRKSWSIKTYPLFLCSVDRSHVFKRNVNYKHFCIITKHVTKFSVSSTDLLLVISAAVYAYVVEVITKKRLRKFILQQLLLSWAILRRPLNVGVKTCIVHDTELASWSIGKYFEKAEVV